MSGLNPHEEPPTSAEVLKYAIKQVKQLACWLIGAIIAIFVSAAFLNDKAFMLAFVVILGYTWYVTKVTGTRALQAVREGRKKDLEDSNKDESADKEDSDVTVD